MKKERFILTFESVIETTVYAPEGTTVDQLREIADKIALDPEGRGWVPPRFTARVVSLSPVGAPFAPYGVDRVDCTSFEEEDTVLSDDGQDIVTPTDALWWRE